MEAIIYKIINYKNKDRLAYFISDMGYLCAILKNAQSYKSDNFLISEYMLCDIEISSIRNSINKLDKIKIISEYTNESIVRCSFGGGIYYKYNTETDKVEKCKKDEDVKGQFDRGDCRVLIGTSHIYEGADIPNLDSVILVDIGRSSRKYIQGVGRCLRRTKTGRYAHIIDFTDAQNPILSYHSLLRRKMFTNLIGSSNIYDNISFEEFKKLFAMLELEVIDE